MGLGSCSCDQRHKRRGHFAPLLAACGAVFAVSLAGSAGAQTPEADTPASPLLQVQMPPGQQRVAWNADDCLRRAAVFVRVGDYTRAIESLTRAIALRPDIARLFRNRGYTYLQIAGAERRVQFYSLRLASSPDSASLYLRRGLAYYNTGEYQKAIADCDAALTRFPDYAAAFLTRALAHAAAEHPTEAASDSARAFALLPLSRPAAVSDGSFKLL